MGTYSWKYDIYALYYIFIHENIKDHPSGPFRLSLNIDISLTKYRMCPGKLGKLRQELLKLDP